MEIISNVKVKAERIAKKMKSNSVSSFRGLKSGNNSIVSQNGFPKIKSPRGSGVPLGKKKSDVVNK
jgi:hypothetical protein